MTPFDYLNTSIKSYQRVSSLQGIGLFALVDIKKGDILFQKWEGNTSLYKIKFSEAKLLPREVLSYILRSFVSKNNVLYSQAGAGIVIHSEEAKELQEVNNKLAALKKALVLAENI